MIAERMLSPLGRGWYRTGSSPPSPVFERPPRRFMAMASVVCASQEIDPNDMAPEAKRFTIDSTGSTSSIGTGCQARELEQVAQGDRGRPRRRR